MGANHESEKRFGTLAAMGAASVSQTMSNGVLYRTLGKAGEKVSAIGLGGYHLVSCPGHNVKTSDPSDNHETESVGVANNAGATK